MKVNEILSIMILLFFGMSCSSPQKKKDPVKNTTPTEKRVVKSKKKAILNQEPELVLDEKNAIPFLYEYQQQELPNKVKITTRFGEIVLELFDEAP